jgi:integration host factor subunit beta
MNKVDLIQALKDSNHLSRSEAEKIVTLFFNQMAEALGQGDRVEIRGLCSFFVKKYSGYTGRKPKNRREGQNRSEEAALFQGGQGIEGSGGWLRD